MCIQKLYLNNSSFAKQTTLFCCRLGGNFGSGDKKQKKKHGKMKLLLTFRHKTPQSIYIRPVDLLVGHQMTSQ